MNGLNGATPAEQKAAKYLVDHQGDPKVGTQLFGPTLAFSRGDLDRVNGMAKLHLLGSMQGQPQNIRELAALAADHTQGANSDAARWLMQHATLLSSMTDQYGNWCQSSVFDVTANDRLSKGDNFPQTDQQFSVGADASQPGSPGYKGQALGALLYLNQMHGQGELFKGSHDHGYLQDLVKIATSPDTKISPDEKSACRWLLGHPEVMIMLTPKGGNSFSKAEDMTAAINTINAQP